MGFRDTPGISAPAAIAPFQYSLRIVGFRDSFRACVRQLSDKPFQYSLRIVGFRDFRAATSSARLNGNLSVFPANRGVPRPELYPVLVRHVVLVLSVFPANRGVPRRRRSWTRLPSPLNFHYSLRIVGFRDARGEDCHLVPGAFQYSLRIVGFRDGFFAFPPPVNSRLSVFPANRGVPRPERPLPGRCVSSTFSIPCESWGSATLLAGIRCTHPRPFQYSLRIVGFRDCSYCLHLRSALHKLSVFPANRGVPRQIPSSIRSHQTPYAFSIPCESWGSATHHDIFRQPHSVAFSIPCESWGSAT